MNISCVVRCFLHTLITNGSEKFAIFSKRGRSLGCEERTSFMSLCSIEEYSENVSRAAVRVLDMLDRLESRTAPLYEKQRGHARSQYRGIVRIREVTDDVEVTDFDEIEECMVWGRSVSQSGISFIYPGSHEWQKIFVGIEVPGRGLTWMRAEAVRGRQVSDEDFWEYGVRFLGRADSWSDSSDAND